MGICGDYRVSTRGLREGRLPTARVPSSRVRPGISAARVSSAAGLSSTVRSATATAAAAAEQRTELHGRMVGFFDFDVFVSCSLEVFQAFSPDPAIGGGAGRRFGSVLFSESVI